MNPWRFWTEKKASVGAGRAEDQRTGWQGHTRWDLVSHAREFGPDPQALGTLDGLGRGVMAQTRCWGPSRWAGPVGALPC